MRIFQPCAFITHCAAIRQARVAHNSKSDLPLAKITFGSIYLQFEEKTYQMKGEFTALFIKTTMKYMHMSILIDLHYQSFIRLVAFFNAKEWP